MGIIMLRLKFIRERVHLVSIVIEDSDNRLILLTFLPSFEFFE